MKQRIENLNAKQVRRRKISLEEERGMGIVEGYLFGKLVGKINTNVEILKEELKKVNSSRDEISSAVYLVESKRILEKGKDFIKEVYSRKDSLESGFRERKNIGMCRTIASELDKVIKDYEQARKELCDYVATQKPWGQE